MPILVKGLTVAKALAAATYFKMHRRPLCYWDVGARWGLSRPMQLLYTGGVVQPVFFEPDRDEAARLAQRYTRSTVFDCALSDSCGDATLYITRDPGGSSLLRPINSADVIRTATIRTARADQLTTAIPPEIVKLDVQGYELAALRGFGGLLDHVIGAEIEVSFTTVYENQPLCDDVIAFMNARGFGLADIQVFGVLSTRSAQHANAFFVRREIRTAREEQVDRSFRYLHRIQLVA